MYSDEINFDRLSKLKLDPLSMTFGRLPIHIRNQAFAWRYFGFVHNIKHFDTDSDLDAQTKMKIYHKCLSEIFALVKQIQTEGGIPYEMTLKNGKKVMVNLKIYIQFIIGDTKGHDTLCGQMNSYQLTMKQLVKNGRPLQKQSSLVYVIARMIIY